LKVVRVVEVVVEGGRRWFVRVVREEELVRGGG
jgi:hypothetical protein